jgi:ferredoxin-fold anticodon binding domain-containing protein
MGEKISLGEAKDILNKLAFVSELFDFKREARKHLGKPYSWGASYRTHGDMAFDCSYLTDYIYSLIGKFIGHTSLAQYMLGQPVEGDLAPGDILFVKGKIEKSVTDHYFIPDGSGGHKKIELKKPVEVGHNGLYIGGGRVVHAKHYKYDRKTNTWVKDGKGEVVEEDATVFTENPEYLGARRYVANPDKYLAIDAPWWRLDIKIEEDILEEIGRIYGYQNLPSTLPSGVPAKYDANKNYDFARSVKGALVGFGFNEVLNYSFVSGSVAECADLPLNSLFKVLNPLSPETEYMRASLAGSLITAASKNQDNYGDLRMFEIANTYLRVDGPMPKEQESICILIRHASGDRGVAFTELKGAINSLFEFIRAKKVTFKPSVGHLFAQGASAAILHNGKPIGSLGVLSKKVGMHYGLRGDVALCEIDLSALLASTDSKIVYRKLSKFPAVTRDIPILVSQKIAASEVLLAVTCLDNIFIKEAQIIDIYEGKGLPKDQKSITVRVVLGSDEKTLEEKEIEQVIGSILTNLEERVGGALRTNT